MHTNFRMKNRNQIKSWIEIRPSVWHIGRYIRSYIKIKHLPPRSKFFHPGLWQIIFIHVFFLWCMWAFWMQILSRRGLLIYTKRVKGYFKQFKVELWLSSYQYTYFLSLLDTKRVCSYKQRKFKKEEETGGCK